MTVRVRVPLPTTGAMSTARTMATGTVAAVLSLVPRYLPVPMALTDDLSAVVRSVGDDGDGTGCLAVALCGVRSAAGPARRKGGSLRCGHRPIIARTRGALCSPRPNGR
ncbi:hypothetical protein STENM223S_09625 [Streptomyces tendae]